MLNKLLKFAVKKIFPLVVAGGIALTSCKSQPVQTPTTPTVQPPAQTQTYALKGTVYHDYNGDGIKEDNEPAIPGVELDLIDKSYPPKSIRDNYPVKIVTSGSTSSGYGVTYEIQMKTDSNGNYSIQMPNGNYELDVDKNNVLGPNGQPFRYINISPAEFQKITDPLYFRVDGDTVCNVALMQGFLTLPFGPETKFVGENKFGIEFYSDRDNSVDAINWKGTTGYVYDGHNGTDFYMEENTPILAAAPGVVIARFFIDSNLGYSVLVQHESPYGKYKCLATEYAHLKDKINVKVGDKVKRGDVIGLSGKVPNCGNAGLAYNGEHLHFGVGLLNSWSSIPYGGFYTDPYREIVPLKWHSPGFWSVDNNPQYP